MARLYKNIQLVLALLTINATICVGQINYDLVSKNWDIQKQMYLVNQLKIKDSSMFNAIDQLILKANRQFIFDTLLQPYILINFPQNSVKPIIEFKLFNDHFLFDSTSLEYAFHLVRDFSGFYYKGYPIFVSKKDLLKSERQEYFIFINKTFKEQDNLISFYFYRFIYKKKTKHIYFSYPTFMLIQDYEIIGSELEFNRELIIDQNGIR